MGYIIKVSWGWWITNKSPVTMKKIVLLTNINVDLIHRVGTESRDETKMDQALCLERQRIESVSFYSPSRFHLKQENRYATKWARFRKQIHQRISEVLDARNWMKCGGGILKGSKSAGFHYSCPVNDRRSRADCLSCHALWMAKAKSIGLGVALHSRKGKREGERVGWRTSGWANFLRPPPPEPMPSTNWQSSSKEGYRPQLIPFFSFKDWPSSLTNVKETPTEGHQGTFAVRVAAHKICVRGSMRLLPRASSVATNT